MDDHSSLCNCRWSLEKKFDLNTKNAGVVEVSLYSMTSLERSCGRRPWGHCPACVVPVQGEWVPWSRIWNWDITQPYYKWCLLDTCRIAMDCSVLLCCILCELLYDSSRGEGPIWLLITRKPWWQIASSECLLLLLLVVAFVSVVFQGKTFGTHFPKEIYDSWVTLRVWFVLKISKHPLPTTPKHSNKAVDDAEDPTSQRPIDGRWSLVCVLQTQCFNHIMCHL